MKKNEIARQYSKALYEIGEENGNMGELFEELEEFWNTLQENEQLKEALFHQRVLVEEKQAVLQKGFKDKLSNHMYKFLMLLIEKRRIYFIENILESFRKLMHKHENIITVEVTTAVEMNSELREKLKERLDKLSEASGFDDIKSQFTLKILSLYNNRRINDKIAKLVITTAKNSNAIDGKSAKAAMAMLNNSGIVNWNKLNRYIR